MAKAGGKLDDLVAHSVAVKLPTFNKIAPTSWFHLADANFHLRGITASDTKFWYVVSKLDQETLSKLSSFLSKPCGKDPYAEIRDVLCRTFEPKLEQKLDALLVSSDLGDERPSEYELELRRLLSNASTEDILKKIFTRSLPKYLRDAISPNVDESFNGLADAADRAWALNSAERTVTAVAPVVSQSQRARGGSQQGRGTRQRGKQSGRQETSRSVVLCPFHLKWGDAAMLGLVMDKISGKRCLLDSGSQISLWPASSNHQKICTSTVQLVAANGTKIKSFGSAQRKIQIGLEKYSFVFVFVEITRPILGIDFLQHFGMTLDLAGRRLLHSGTETAFTSSPKGPVVCGINIVSDFESTAEQLLAEFPEITDVNRATRS